MSNEQVTKPADGKSRRSVWNLVVNRRFQFRYVFMVSLSGLLLAGMYSRIFYKYTRENYSILVDLAPMTDEVKAQLYAELSQIVLMLLGGSLLFILMTSVVALVFSHRVAGPLYHFRRVFEEVRAGKRDARVHLRPNDEFQDVAKACNDMLDELLKKN